MKRCVLEFSLCMDPPGSNPGMGSKHTCCSMKMVAGGSVSTGDAGGHSPFLPASEGGLCPAAARC